MAKDNVKKVGKPDSTWYQQGLTALAKAMVVVVAGSRVELQL